jgi:putative toxin-antitoxin system antitoxin component (TIGR02293 family)
MHHPPASTRKKASPPPKAEHKMKLSRNSAAIPITEAGIAKQIKALSSRYSIAASVLAEILDVSPKTFSRYQGNAKALSFQQKDRIGIVQSILILGKRVLGTEEEVKRWLYRPVHSIENRKPIDLIVTESGRRRVENVLLQIEGGVY